MTQNNMLIYHMRKHGSITTMEAFQKYGVTRISARIWEIKRMGFDVETVKETNKNGKTYARYSLKEGKDGK